MRIVATIEQRSEGDSRVKVSSFRQRNPVFQTVKLASVTGEGDPHARTISGQPEPQCYQNHNDNTDHYLRSPAAQHLNALIVFHARDVLAHDLGQSFEKTLGDDRVPDGKLVGTDALEQRR